MDDVAELLFVYGPFTRPEVQLETFGRRVEASSDVLDGYRLAMIDVDLPNVAVFAGPGRQPVLRETGDPLDKTVGEVLAVTPDELEAADEYAAPTYRRIRVSLASGRDAWAYVGMPSPPAAD
jgi:hypothetical protein